MRRFDQFLKARGKCEAGEFDFVDVDLQDLLGTAQPHAEARPAIEPAGDIATMRGMSRPRSTVLSVAKMTVKNRATMRRRRLSIKKSPLQVLKTKQVATRNKFCETKPICPWSVVRCPLVSCKVEAIDELRCDGRTTRQNCQRRCMTPADTDRELRRLLADHDWACDGEAQSTAAPLTRPAADLSPQGRGERIRRLAAFRGSKRSQC